MSQIPAEARIVRSVSEAIDALADDALMRDIRPDGDARRGDDSFGLWFRGHERVSYELTPSILRESKRKSGRYVNEMSLVRHFKAMNPTAASERATDFDWLVTMQHYLAPTRLLDWTENLLVALYFAVRNAQSGDQEDSAVWLLNARRLNYYASATTRMTEVAFPTDPDVVARSVLSRVRERTEWHDAFVREVKLLRVDRADYRIERIRKAISAAPDPKPETGRRGRAKTAAAPATVREPKPKDSPVKLQGGEINDNEALARNLRAYPVGKTDAIETINIYDKSSFNRRAGIYTRLRLPVAVYPGRTNDRIRSQAGVFTLHGGTHVHNPTKFPSDRSFTTPIGLPISLVELDAGCQRRRILKWLRIPKECRADIRKTLALIGVTDATLFPELDYQSKYLLSRWTHHEEPDELEEGEAGEGPDEEETGA